MSDVVESPKLQRRVRSSIEPRGLPHFSSSRPTSRRSSRSPSAAPVARAAQPPPESEVQLGDASSEHTSGAVSEAPAHMHDAAKDQSENLSTWQRICHEPAYRLVVLQWSVFGCIIVALLILAVPWRTLFPSLYRYGMKYATDMLSILQSIVLAPVMWMGRQMLFVVRTVVWIPLSWLYSAVVYLTGSAWTGLTYGVGFVGGYAVQGAYAIAGTVSTVASALSGMMQNISVFNSLGPWLTSLKDKCWLFVDYVSSAVSRAYESVTSIPLAEWVSFPSRERLQSFMGDASRALSSALLYVQLLCMDAWEGIVNATRRTAALNPKLPSLSNWTSSESTNRTFPQIRLPNISLPAFPSVSSVLDGLGSARISLVEHLSSAFYVVITTASHWAITSWEVLRHHGGDSLAFAATLPAAFWSTVCSTAVAFWQLLISWLSSIGTVLQFSAITSGAKAQMSHFTSSAGNVVHSLAEPQSWYLANVTRSLADAFTNAVVISTTQAYIILSSVWLSASPLTEGENRALDADDDAGSNLNEASSEPLREEEANTASDIPAAKLESAVVEAKAEGNDVYSEPAVTCAQPVEHNALYNVWRSWSLPLSLAFSPLREENAGWENEECAAAASSDGSESEVSPKLPSDSSANPIVDTTTHANPVSPSRVEIETQECEQPNGLSEDERSKEEENEESGQEASISNGSTETVQRKSIVGSLLEYWYGFRQRTPPGKQQEEEEPTNTSRGNELPATEETATITTLPNNAVDTQPTAVEPIQPIHTPSPPPPVPTEDPNPIPTPTEESVPSSLQPTQSTSTLDDTAPLVPEPSSEVDPCEGVSAKLGKEVQQRKDAEDRVRACEDNTQRSQSEVDRLLMTNAALQLSFDKGLESTSLELERERSECSAARDAYAEEVASLTQNVATEAQRAEELEIQAAENEKSLAECSAAADAQRQELESSFTARIHDVTAQAEAELQSTTDALLKACAANQTALVASLSLECEGKLQEMRAEMRAELLKLSADGDSCSAAVHSLEADLDSCNRVVQQHPSALKTAISEYEQKCSAMIDEQVSELNKSCESSVADAIAQRSRELTAEHADAMETALHEQEMHLVEAQRLACLDAVNAAREEVTRAEQDACAKGKSILEEELTASCDKRFESIYADVEAKRVAAVLSAAKAECTESLKGCGTRAECDERVSQELDAANAECAESLKGCGTRAECDERVSQELDAANAECAESLKGCGTRAECDERVSQELDAANAECAESLKGCGTRAECDERVSQELDAANAECAESLKGCGTRAECDERVSQELDAANAECAESLKGCGTRAECDERVSQELDAANAECAESLKGCGTRAECDERVSQELDAANAECTESLKGCGTRAECDERVSQELDAANAECAESLKGCGTRAECDERVSQELDAANAECAESLKGCGTRAECDERVSQELDAANAECAESLKGCGTRAECDERVSQELDAANAECAESLKGCGTRAECDERVSQELDAANAECAESLKGCGTRAECDERVSQELDAANAECAESLKGCGTRAECDERVSQELDAANAECAESLKGCGTRAECDERVSQELDAANAECAESLKGCGTRAECDERVSQELDAANAECAESLKGCGTRAECDERVSQELDAANAECTESLKGCGTRAECDERVSHELDALEQKLRDEATANSAHLVLAEREACTREESAKCVSECDERLSEQNHAQQDEFQTVLQQRISAQRVFLEDENDAQLDALMVELESMCDENVTEAVQRERAACEERVKMHEATAQEQIHAAMATCATRLQNSSESCEVAVAEAAEAASTSSWMECSHSKQLLEEAARRTCEANVQESILRTRGEMAVECEKRVEVLLANASEGCTGQIDAERSQMEEAHALELERVSSQRVAAAEVRAREICITDNEAMRDQLTAECTESLKTLKDDMDRACEEMVIEEASARDEACTTRLALAEKECSEATQARIASELDNAWRTECIPMCANQSRNAASSATEAAKDMCEEEKSSLMQTLRSEQLESQSAYQQSLAVLLSMCEAASTCTAAESPPPQEQLDNGELVKKEEEAEPTPLPESIVSRAFFHLLYRLCYSAIVIILALTTLYQMYLRRRAAFHAAQNERLLSYIDQLSQNATPDSNRAPAHQTSNESRIPSSIARDSEQILKVVPIFLAELNVVCERWHYTCCQLLTEYCSSPHDSRSRRRRPILTSDEEMLASGSDRSSVRPPSSVNTQQHCQPDASISSLLTDQLSSHENPVGPNAESTRTSSDGLRGVAQHSSSGTATGSQYDALYVADSETLSDTPNEELFGFDSSQDSPERVHHDTHENSHPERTSSHEARSSLNSGSMRDVHDKSPDSLNQEKNDRAGKSLLEGVMTGMSATHPTEMNDSSSSAAALANRAFLANVDVLISQLVESLFEEKLSHFVSLGESLLCQKDAEIELESTARYERLHAVQNVRTALVAEADELTEELRSTELQRDLLRTEVEQLKARVDESERSRAIQQQEVSKERVTLQERIEELQERLRVAVQNEELAKQALVSQRTADELRGDPEQNDSPKPSKSPSRKDEGADTSGRRSSSSSAARVPFSHSPEKERVAVRSVSHASIASSADPDDSLEEHLRDLLIKENQEKHALKLELSLLRHQHKLRAFEERTLHELLHKGIRRTYPLGDDTAQAQEKLRKYAPTNDSDNLDAGRAANSRGRVEEEPKEPRQRSSRRAESANTGSDGDTLTSRDAQDAIVSATSAYQRNQPGRSAAIISPSSDSHPRYTVKRSSQFSFDVDNDQHGRDYVVEQVALDPYAGGSSQRRTSAAPRTLSLSSRPRGGAAAGYMPTALRSVRPPTTAVDAAPPHIANRHGSLPRVVEGMRTPPSQTQETAHPRRIMLSPSIPIGKFEDNACERTPSRPAGAVAPVTSSSSSGSSGGRRTASNGADEAQNWMIHDDQLEALRQMANHGVSRAISPPKSLSPPRHHSSSGESSHRKSMRRAEAFTVEYDSS